MKYKIIAGIILIAAAFFAYLFFTNPDSPKTTAPNQPSSVSEKDPPTIVKTVPDSLDGTIIPADQIIEIVFNRALENAGEFKLRVETKNDIKVELSSDRKTAKIIPLTPYELGTSYTIFIGPETKFDGVGRWGQEKVYHFRTIRYTGV